MTTTTDAPDRDLGPTGRAVGTRARLRIGVASVGAVAGVLMSVAPAHAVAPACGSTLTADTVLTADLICPGNGLNINAANVTLDLNGHSITGPGADVRPAPGQIFAGVRVLSNRSGVTVKNGRVQGFTIGITTQTGANGTDLSGLNLSSNGQGFFPQFNATTGARSDDNRLHASQVLNSTGIGVVLQTNGNVVEGNVIAGNANSGIFVGGGSQGNRVVGNAFAGNTTAFVVPSVSVTGATGTLVANNSVSGRPVGPGIFVSRSAGTVVTGNQVTGNNEGILVRDGSTGTQVSENSAVQNNNDGIRVESPGSTVTANTAHNNRGMGIRAALGVTDGGNNRASGNLGGQCTPNIACT